MLCNIHGCIQNLCQKPPSHKLRCGCVSLPPRCSQFAECHIHAQRETTFAKYTLSIWHRWILTQYLSRLCWLSSGIVRDRVLYRDQRAIFSKCFKSGKQDVDQANGDHAAIPWGGVARSVRQAADEASSTRRCRTPFRKKRQQPACSHALMATRLFSCCH